MDIEMGDKLDYLGGTNLNLFSSQKWKREAEEWFRKMWCEDLTTAPLKAGGRGL